MTISYNSQTQWLNEQIVHDAEWAQSWLEKIVGSCPLDTMEVRLVALVARLENALAVVRKSNRDLRMTLAQAPALQSTQKQTQSSGPTPPDSEDLYSTVQIPRVTDVYDSSQDQEYEESSYATPPKGFLSESDGSSSDETEG